jgi:hypothetical protein
MKVSKAMSTLCQELVTAQVVDRYAKRHKMQPTDALRYFMGTKTYLLLQNHKSYLYLESAPYILDMLDAEEHSDWQRWLII